MSWLLSPVDYHTYSCNVWPEVEEKGVKARTESDRAQDSEPDPPRAPHEVRLSVLKVLPETKELHYFGKNQ